MLYTPTKLSGVYLIDLEKREDARGYFARCWCASEFAEHGLPPFVQTNMSLCRNKGTIRGMHYQVAPYGEAKYMRCIAGAICVVAVDIRPSSPSYKQWIAVELSAANRRATFVPDGLAHAYQAMTDDAEVMYSASRAYAPGAERGIRWNDPAFSIEWPIREAIVSDKDSKWPDWSAL